MITSLVAVLVLVLLVVAANVANLVAARIASRASELAVRTALGAPRSRLIGQLSVEVAVLGVAAAVLGMALARSALRWLDVQMGHELPFWIEIAPGPWTGLFVVAVTVAATVVAGVLPALRATRRDPAGRLRGASAGGGGLGRLGAAVMVGEMALSVALLTGALVMARGFVNHLGGDLALPRGEVITARIVEPEGASRPGLRPALLRAVRAVPGVVASGTATQLPRIDPPARLTELAAEAGERAAEPEPAPVAGVDPGFFEALGASATLGRLLREEDFRPEAPPVAVVNQPFVDKFLAGRNPLGRRLRDAEPAEDGAPAAPWREIVGVVPDLGLFVADPRRAAGYYVPMEAAPPAYYLAVRTLGAPLELAEPLRRAIAGVEPEIFIQRMLPLEQVGLEDRAFMSGFGTALTGMGGMAMLLSLAGIYAMLSFAVTRRTREIGVRLALGATAGRVLRSIVGRAALHLAAGAVLGAGLAVLLCRGKSLLVTRLPADEPWVLPSVIAVLLVAGVVASWVPARRALAIEATEALRAE